MSPAQKRMLSAFATGAQAGDVANYYGAGGGTLAWRNSDRVLGALLRKGWIVDDPLLELAITPEGLTALAAEDERQTQEALGRRRRRAMP